MSYDNSIGISQLRNCNLHNSDHNLTKMCEELYYINSSKKTGRRVEEKLGREEDMVFNAWEMALKG